MLKRVLNKSNWDKRRLAMVLTLFFFALAIPTAILIKQAYSQLKWEAFHHYRLQAEELATRIDLRYKELIDIESARTFTDYSFLNIAGNIQDKVLQRSPLSTFPVNSKFPGIIGYFQIDNNGQFTTPLLPDETARHLTKQQSFGMTAAEKIKRQRAHNQIHQILTQNKLLNKLAIQVAKKDKRQTIAEESLAGNVQREKMEMRDDYTSAQGITSELAQEEPAASPAPQAIASKAIKPQAAFDKLQTQQSFSSANSKPNQYSKSKRRVEDLKLKKQYQKKALEKKQSSKYKQIKQKRSRRKESNVLPAYALEEKEYSNQPNKKDKTLRISMFESEIDSFEFSLLESGHFVLYRKVWRNGHRYIQGLLIKPDLFVDNVIAKSFYKTNVSAASNLTVAYQGNILSTLSSKTSRSFYSSKLKSPQDEDLQGTLLLQNKLSAALDQIELIFSVNNLPAGPGGTVINWLSIILLLILCGGFFVLYRLGVKQLTLARQQQDFVSAVSHELKTPLTSIRMYGEMLREGWTTEEKRKQYYDYIFDESERLTRLINNVLQLARMNRNEIPVELKSYSITELLDTVRSKISSQVERTKFQLELDCDENISQKHILADADYFIQIIINLVDNAIKFSAKAEKHQIDIQCKALRNNKIQFSVRDYGPGVNKDQMRKIFSLFYRSENELTRETVGTGIGLSLVKQLVKSMQGEIDVVNKEPGVEFQITFNVV